MKKKKTIKIFCLPSHATKERVSGVDFARVIQPMTFLNGYEDDEVKFETKIFDPNNLPGMNWMQVADKYDIIFLNYINDPWGFAAMGAMARHYGKKIVFEIDDALWRVKPDNTAYEVYKKGSEGAFNLTAIMNVVDHITTTNDYLRNIILGETTRKAKDITILPNYIDLDGLYTHRARFNTGYEFTLMHFGSTTHFIDLGQSEFIKGIDRIMKEYPNVKFKTVGAMIAEFKQMWGARYENAYGDQDLFKWVREKFPNYMDEADALVVPLADTVYDRAKTSIKFLEASSAKVPGVWQRIRQYEETVDDGKNGFLAGTANEWYEKIKQLIDNTELRKSMGEEALKTVEKEWQMKQHVKDYAEMFKKVLAS